MNHFKVYDIVDLQCGTAISSVQFQLVFTTPTENPMPIKQSLPHFPSPLDRQSSLLLSLDLPRLDVSYEWTHEDT